jgi:tetratricopeptide (TPR) repeat protein
MPEVDCFFGWNDQRQSMTLLVPTTSNLDAMTCCSTEPLQGTPLCHMPLGASVQLLFGIGHSDTLHNDCLAANCFHDERRDLGGQHELAIDDLSTLARHYPNSCDVYKWRGGIYRKGNQLDKALQDHNMVLGLEVSAQALINRGWCYFLREEYSLAVADYTNAISIEPSYSAYTNRGEAYSEMAHHDLATVDYQRVIALVDQTLSQSPAESSMQILLCSRGVAYLGLGRYREALDDLDRAIEVRPKWYDTYQYRGRVHMLLGHPDLAIADYSQCVAINPLCFNAMYLRGVAHQATGNHSCAISDFANAFQLLPTNSKIRAAHAKTTGGMPSICAMPPLLMHMHMHMPTDVLL